MKILLTGGTGFLGRAALAGLENLGQVHVLSRRKGLDLHGDLTRWNAGLNLDQIVNEKFDILIHLAALYDLKANQVSCYKNNLLGTSNALKLAQILKIPRFINASSVAASVNVDKEFINGIKLPVQPYDLNLLGSFPDPYSESKALAEQQIKNWQGIPLKINLRFGMLVGDTRNGEIDRIDGPYYAPQIMKSMRRWMEALPTSVPMPGASGTRLPLVPVDIAANALTQFAMWAMAQTCAEAESQYQSFHLVPREGLSLMKLYRSTLKHCKIKTKGLFLVEKSPLAVTEFLAQHMARFPKEALNYLLQFPRYENQDTSRILGKNWCPEFEVYEKAFWSGYEKNVSNS